MPKPNVKFPNISRKLKVEYRSIDELIPYARNARTHSRSQIRKLQRSLRKFGWTNPILIDGAGNIICGHGRLEAARRNGETVVPVINLGQMSEADRRAYILADNRLAEEAQWSKELLRSELSGLIELGYEVELTGFDAFEIDGVLNFGGDEDCEQDIVELPEPDAVTFRKGREADLAAHSTVKPTSLVADFLLDCSNRGDLVVDPCLGSGTTLIAAHRTGRRGAGIELDPGYVDTALKRLRSVTGIEPVLAGDGRTFDEVTASRAITVAEG